MSALMLSRLEYCDSLVVGLLKHSLKTAQNNVVCIVFCSQKARNTPPLRELLCQTELALITRSLHCATGGLAHLSELMIWWRDLPPHLVSWISICWPLCATRPESPVRQKLLFLPWPHHWNSQPLFLRTVSIFDVFRSKPRLFLNTFYNSRNYSAHFSFSMYFVHFYHTSAVVCFSS